MALTPGTRLGPYEIQAAIGAGGMGEVYLAHDTRLNRRVALKSLSGPSVGTPEARARLLREARTAAQLTHPNIAAIHDVLDAAPCPCIVMEYVQGETLSAKIARGPLPPAEAVSIGVQLAGALAQAHAAGVVHRDLKPANVQVTPDGIAKILDFGLARSRDLEDPGVVATASARAVAESQAGKLTGTPAYMAPEQLMGKPATPQSDVYALGVLLFEALSGRRPFDATDFVDLALGIVSGPTPVLRTGDTGVPPDLSGIVARAMARKPADRYPSAAALADDLQRAGRAFGDQPTVETPGTREPEDVLRIVRRRLNRRRLTAAAGALVVIAALAVAAATMWRNRPAPATTAVAPGIANVAVVPLKNSTGETSKDFVGVGISEWLTAALADIESLNVISRSDARRSLASDADASTIARDENAGLVVGGTVHQADDQLRLTIKVQKPDDSVVWSANYARPMSERLELYSLIANEVAHQLGVPVSATDRVRFARGPLEDLDAYDEYSAGRTLLDRDDVPGNIDKAISAFERAVKKEPNFVLGHVELGEAFWAQYSATQDPVWAGRAQKAIEAALAIYPADPDVRISLGVVYAKTGRAEEATSELRAALKVRPTSDYAHRELANALRDLNRDQEALAHYRQALRIRPDYFRNNMALGLFYYRKGQYEDAATWFQRVTQVQPDSNMGFINLGAAYMRLGANDLALENFEQANTIAPDGVTFSNIGTIHYSDGRYAEAVEAFQEAIRLGQKNHTSHRNLGDAYLKLGRRDRARAEFETAAALSDELLKVNPRDAPTLACLGVYEAKIGRVTDAIRHINDAVAISPANVDVLYKRAVVYALAGREADAVRALEVALKQGYIPALARADDDLDSIRRLPQVQRLLIDGT